MFHQLVTTPGGRSACPLAHRQTLVVFPPSPRQTLGGFPPFSVRHSAVSRPPSVPTAPAVEEDEPQVEAGAEHERAAVQADLGDGRRGQRMADSHQTPRHGPATRGGRELQVAAAVDCLAIVREEEHGDRDSGSTGGCYG